MHFKRVFTTEGKHPFDSINWVKTTSTLKDVSGKIIFSQPDVEFPDFWNQSDIDIFVEKYFAGAVGSRVREVSLKQSITRIVKWYKDCGIKDKYFDTEKDAQVFADELMYLFVNQYFSFNSPVLFNVGVVTPPQTSACFILSADDTMKSIRDNAGVEMSIFEKGSGAGSNRSNLRSSVERISGGGTAMGPLAAERIYDAVAGATKSGGKLRRAAKMSSLDIDHGDVELFIKQKAIVEKMAWDLKKLGWNTDFDHPESVYRFLPLQNFNESVGVFDAFMEAVKKDEKWSLVERRTTALPIEELVKETARYTSQGTFLNTPFGEWLVGEDVDHGQKVIKTFHARELFTTICNSAWMCGDPGVQFLDTMNKWHTCKADGKIRASNPCGEFLHLDDTSCNLASLNLVKFDENDIFNTLKFERAIELLITAQDISVHNSSYPTKEITTKTKLYRNLGLGYTNLGALLLRKGLPYDSVEARYFTGAVTSLLTATAYKQSARLAKALGAFERYEDNKESVVSVLQLHLDAAEKLKYKVSLELENKPLLKNTILHLLETSTKNAVIHEPVRNAQVTVIAPAGTISFIMGADTTGCEPVLGLVSYKKLVGGGYLKLTTPSVTVALTKLGYTASDIVSIVKYIEDNDTIVDAPGLKQHHLPVFATSFGHTNTLSPAAHIKMLGEIQPFISGGISKTVNLPNSATVEDIAEIYMEAWQAGLKSIALYRDGSKASQPLNVKKDEAASSNGRPKPVRKKLPKDRPAKIHEFSVGGQKGYLKLGFYPDSGKLGEVFIDVSKAGSTINGLIDHIGILTSMLLQYGVDIDEVINKFKDTKFEPSGMTSNPDIQFASSINDYIGKYLDKLQIDTVGKVQTKKKESSLEFDGPPCLKCGHLTHKSGSCYTCRNCGATTSCS